MNRRGEFESGTERYGEPAPGAQAGPGAEPHGQPGRDPRTASKRQRSLGTLLGDLTTESRVLVRQEVALAKAEASEKIEVLQRSSLLLAVGAVFGVAALLTLVAALHNGLVALLNEVVALEVAVWLAPLILAVLLGGIAWAFIARAREKLQRERLTLDRTAESLREDTQWIKEKVS
jgi:hypothetical protein